MVKLSFGYKNTRGQCAHLLLSIVIYVSSIIAGYIYIFTCEPDTSFYTRMFRFVFLPICGLLVGLKIFKSDILCFGDKVLATRNVVIILATFFVLYCVSIISLKYLKLTAYNYELFDAGIYINKLWRLSNSNFIDALRIAFVEGHFQPSILFFAYIYSFFDDPISVFILETIFLATGVIPVYFIAQIKLSNNLAASLISIIYLINPLLQFNDILGFHPDHVVLPALLWAFYFAEVKSYALTILMLLIIGCAGEQWLPASFAFGIYLWYVNGQKKIGISVSIFFFLMFIILLFVIFPIYGSNTSGLALIGVDANHSSYATLLTGDFRNSDHNLFDPKKLFFLFFLFFPLLFLPFASLTFLLFGIFELIKTLGSTDLHHYSVEGHYTLVLIAVSFIGYIDILHKVKKVYGLNYVFIIPIISIIITFTFLVAHSPLPISYDFWTNWSSGTFNIAQYEKTGRTEALERIEKLVGNNPYVNIEITNSAFTPNLAKRFGGLGLFPSNDWKNASYIIIDKTRYKGAGSHSQQTVYLANLYTALSQLPIFYELIYDDPYVQLWGLPTFKIEIL